MKRNNRSLSYYLLRQKLRKLEHKKWPLVLARFLLFLAKLLAYYHLRQP